MTTYITNIGLLATPRGDSARRGRQQGEITLLRDAWVAVEGGKIAAVGQGQPVPEAGDTLLDAGGRLMTPGLVDAHTHLIFGGWRQNELGQKLRGVPYLDILAQGGGILSTVRATRAASEEQLAHKAEAVLAEMLRMGVTTCEAKSGYGLEPEQEYKQLRVIRRLNETQPVELAATFMGAHALPEEYRERREDYIRLLCREMIPYAAREGLAEFCDVFCEEGVFTARESRTILEAGLAHGLRPKVHADEIAAMRRASQINDQVVEAAIAAVRAGAVESELAAYVEGLYRQHGADRSGEGQLVCFGPNGADPHHAPNGTVLRDGDSVVLDIFIPIRRYWCDMTRTVFFRSVSDEGRRVYETVKAANLAAEAVIRPGVPMKDIDRAARKLIEDAGYGPFFTHRLGHGCGLDCHEPPDNSASSPAVAEPGMVFSVEPGIYLPGKLGVRIEDLVLVTEDGCEVLNHASKELRVVD